MIDKISEAIDEANKEATKQVIDEQKQSLKEFENAQQ